MSGQAGAAAAAQEERLIARLVALQTRDAGGAAERQGWYADALSFLQEHGSGHWWCQHGDVTAGLAEVLRYHDGQPLVQGIWRQLAAQLAVCTDCVNAHHQAQQLFGEQFAPESARPLLAVLRRLDAERLAGALAGVQVLGEGQELPAEVVAALFEGLTYDALLQDAEVADGLAGALCTLSARYDLALAEPGGARYPGAYRLLAHPSADARRLVAGMVKTWGPFQAASELELVLPTLQHWLATLAGPATPQQDAGSEASRPLFRPPAVAVWRALHGLLPLLQGEAAAALLPALPQLAEAVLAGIGGMGCPAEQSEGELCTWFAVGCWAHLLAAAGPDLFYHTTWAPAAVVQQLAAAALGSSSERLHKAAASAVAATLLHAAGGGGSQEEAVAALRGGLLLLLHDIPGAAAASQQPQQQQQAPAPRCSMLAAALAEAAAFKMLLQLLAKGGASAVAVFRCAHFWLPPLCVSLRQRDASGAGAASAAQQQRSPALFASADKAALRLAAALLAGEVAALTGSPTAAAGSDDAAVAAVAAAAAADASAWVCLPALWHSLSRGSASQDCSSLLLGAMAALASAPLKPGAALAPGAARAAAAGFAASGLSSALAADVAAAQRLVPAYALRHRFLEDDLAAPSPSAIAVSRGAAFLAEQLQQAGAEHLALLARLCRSAAAAPPGERPWAADLESWQAGVVLPLARLLVARNLLSQSAAEELAMAVTRQGSPAAAAAVLVQQHPATAEALRPLLARQQQQLRQPASGNRFVRQQAPQQQQQQQKQQQQKQPSLQRPASPAAADVIDLTDSPERQPATAAPAPSRQQQQQQQDAPWYLQWPSQREQQPPPALQQQAQQQQERPPDTRPQQQQQKQQKQQSAAGIDIDRLWPAEWSVPERQTAAQRAPTVRQQQQQLAGSRSQRPISREPPRQHEQQVQEPASARQPASKQQVVDVDSLWPASWPARKPPSSSLKTAGSSSSLGALGRAGSRGGSRSASPEPAAAQRRRPEEPRRGQGPGSRSTSAELPGSRLASTGQKAGAAGGAFRIPKRQPAAAGAAPAAAEQQRKPAAVPSKLPPVPAPAPARRPPVLAHPGTRAVDRPGAAAVPAAQPAAAAAAAQRKPSLASELQALEEDESLFAGLEPVLATQQPRRPAQAPPRLQQQQPQQQPVVRRIVRLAAPPPSKGRRGAAAPADVPLWQQRRAALGAARQQAAAAASLLTMDSLLQRLLGWDPRRLLSPGGDAALQGGLKVPARFSSLGQYTEIFSQLLLEEVRAHLQQAAEESPLAAALPSSGGGGDWAQLSAALGASGAVPLRLQEVQRQSNLHVLRLEPSASGGPASQAAPRPPESASEFSRSSGIRADDLLLLVSRPAAPGGVPGGGQVAVALATVDSLHQQQLSERRQTQGMEGRHRQLLLTARVSLRGGSGGAAAHAALQQQLTAGTSWQAVRLMSLTPHLRQLQALVAAQRLPPLLLAELLSPGTTALRAGAAHRQPKQQLAAVQPPLPSPLLQALQAQYNSSQQAAIASAIAGYQPAATAAAAGAGAGSASASNGARLPSASAQQQHFLLVQGPPGTGKSAAILGMCSAYLAANTPRGGAKATGSAAAAAATAAKPGTRAAAVVNPTVRVLLAAQSNAAVDELCTRLAARGVVGRDGAPRQVSIVRFGPLEAVSADAAVHHIDAAAAQMQASDAGLGDCSGQSAQLAARLQSLRAELRALQAQIDALDGTVAEGRKRRQQQAAAGQQERGRKRRREAGGGGGSGGSDGETSSSMDLSGSESEDDGIAAAADPLPSSQEVRQQLGPLLQRKQQLKRDAAAAAGALRASSGAAAARRKELRAAVVAQSEVVAATLSSSGGELLQLMPRAGGAAGGALLGFDAIVVDEAAQALEPSVLIALQLLAPGGRLVLVGDPQQLPATVVSRAAAAASLAQSLFERLAQAGYPLVMLRQQYRMHPAISAWPSAFFYQGRLLDAPAVRPGPDGTGGRAAPWHARRRLPPLAFWDCPQGRERGGGGGGASVSNQEEAEVAWALYCGLAARHRGELGDVAVLTPYRAQLALLRRTFQQRGGLEAAEAVTFATVDGFQGREADVVLFSCVRAHASGGGVGFLADVRRMNVALTRARRSLFVVGHSATLAGCEPWRELLEHCRRERCLFTAAPPFERLLAD